MLKNILDDSKNLFTFVLMLSISDITKSYGELEVLRGVTFDIKAGEIVAVIGPSGAGKTTLLQIIGTLDRPDKGKVLYFGEDVFSRNDRSLSEFRNRSIGFVFQSHQLLPEFTLAENVMLPALIGGETIKEARSKALMLLREVGLEERYNHKPSQLSGGECQRGAVARALINTPSIVFADEPTGNLDSANSAELESLFFYLRDKHGTTFVIVTHDTELASRCDRIIRIIDGKIIGE